MGRRPGRPESRERDRILSRPLTHLAWANVALHALGLAIAAIGMRPGTPAVPLAERMAYVAGQPFGWSAGWGVWIGCVPCLIGFLILMAKSSEQRELAGLAVIFGVVGAAFDLCCDALYIVVLPMFARVPAGGATFVVVERAVGVGSLLVANGFYSIAVLLATQALCGRPGLVPGTIAAGRGVSFFGGVLALAAFTGSPLHVELASAATIGLHCVWVLLVARSIEPPAA